MGLNEKWSMVSLMKHSPLTITHLNRYQLLISNQYSALLCCGSLAVFLSKRRSPLLRC